MNQELYNAIWGHSLADIKKYALEAENINSKNKKSETALMSAVNRGDPDIVITLLTIPSLKLEVRNKHKQTALFLAAKNGETQICEILLDAGAKINSKDYSEGNVLLAAIQKPECFKALLKYNPDMHCRNDLNMSCLTYLYKDKNIDLIEHLVSYSKDISDIDNFHQQRKDIYIYHVKNNSLPDNELFNKQVENVIEKIKLKLELDITLEQKSTKSLKTKI
jgi:ankyrin repeat protein